MKLVELRAEVKARGLITNGDKAPLEERLALDDTYEVFRPNLTSMSEDHLRQLCIARRVPSVGKHATLVQNLERYNEYKRNNRTIEDREVCLNAGMPLPNERLGKPTGEPIKGTRGSSAFLNSYDKYLQKFMKKNGTTENAVTLQYWREAQHADNAELFIPCECLKCLIKNNSPQDTDNKA